MSAKIYRLPVPCRPNTGHGVDDVWLVLDGIEHHVSPEDALALASEMAFRASEALAMKAEADSPTND